ncbi:FAD-dependent oxidoreductase [Desulfococcus multivorans]|uniref:FAD-dependent pyridine nucleotide-disulfide oxidoreductase n=1 Tax=Desulfococcus multivorans DSM 2059 TaxID=1121405 RepID=S7V4J3_DESML|nr:FAD-dependent oxidoreductase [Desulfococcus multivorans]AQV00925.1 hypothetical protein B2D07_09210 [Desulfococcus multivorans]EPR41519.1 FAD-dependent pyridine nucleotide-disulfide oxidoreductase [Desulfococcus multivorans DSM 2059]SJZ45102.1 NADPH-dependent glutamate synthase beta chain [Desulfococcus multivorans DSM 2059]
MTYDPEIMKETPMRISRSNISTEINKTGSWRFVRPGYDEKTAPCSSACPVGEDIARIEMLVGQGMFPAAWETILRENPFPAVCGRVCFHPCERVCNRGRMDSPVGIHHLERFVGDLAIENAYAVPHPFYGDEAEADRRAIHGKKIAIAGAGPAGLSAAYFLTRLGHACDVFDADSEPGGVLRWGIPWYRLPEDALKAEISRIVDMGVNIYCRKPVTAEFLAGAAASYDAVFLGCGHGHSLQMGIPGGEKVQDGLRYLHDIRRGENTCSGGTAAVIGGGNTAVDVAQSLIRLGVDTVIVYRRRRRDMPAFDHEIRMALAEGIRLMELAAPVRIDNDGDRLTLTLQEMRITDMETAGGRCRVVPDGERTRILKVDQVYSAIGAEPSESWYRPPEQRPDVLRMSHCTLWAHPASGLPLVFGGDLTAPVRSVTDAVASGKQAAMMLDTLFREGKAGIPERIAQCRVGDGPALSMEIYLSGSRKSRNPAIVPYTAINTDYFTPADRAVPPTLSPLERRTAFEEVEGGYSPETAVREATRCFNCGICNDCDNCRLYCPEVAIYMDGTRCINLDYCKGCGICVVECPRNAMTLEEEQS